MFYNGEHRNGLTIYDGIVIRITMSTLFNHLLRAIIKPALEKHGFVFNGGRRFIKRENAKVMIIEFQVGQRFMEGKFTINLISENTTVRLGVIRQTPFSRMVNRLFGNFNPWWKGLLLPHDKWWKIGTTENDMKKSFNRALQCLENHGLMWFYCEHSNMTQK